MSTMEAAGLPHHASPHLALQTRPGAEGDDAEHAEDPAGTTSRQQGVRCSKGLQFNLPHPPEDAEDAQRPRDSPRLRVECELRGCDRDDAGNDRDEVEHREGRKVEGQAVLRAGGGLPRQRHVHYSCTTDLCEVEAQAVVSDKVRGQDDF